MNTSQNNNDFKDENEALEHLISERADQKKKDQWRERFRPKKKQKQYVKIYRIAAIAACMALVAYFFTQDVFPSQDIQSYAGNMLHGTSFDLTEATRGTQEGQLYSQAYAFIKNKNFDVARSEFEALMPLQTNEAKFFYLVSLVKSESTDYNQILNLSSEVKDKKDKFYTEALWISTIAHIKTNQIEIAQQELVELKARGYKKDNVKNLLKQLN